jgi:hypothetical protein
MFRVGDAARIWLKSNRNNRELSLGSIEITSAALTMHCNPPAEKKPLIIEK